MKPAPIKGVKRRGRPKRDRTVQLDPKSNKEIQSASVVVPPPPMKQKDITGADNEGHRRRKRRRRNNVESVNVDPNPIDNCSRGNVNDTSTQSKNEIGAAKRRKRRAEYPQRRRGHIKPNVKDLSVSLGLEKPPPRLTKAQKSQLTNDELQEQRFKEEIHKLTNLEETLRLSSLQNLGSDDESLNGDGGMEYSDDEDFKGSARPGDAQCPRPVPRRGRGGNKLLRRNNRDVEVSKEEVKEMCLIIRSSMRKSLTTTKTESTLTEDEFDFTDSDLEDLECKVEATAITNDGEAETDSNFIMYRTLRQTLGLQDQWLNDKTLVHASSPKDCARQMCSFNAVHTGSLAKQLYIEHLSWLSIVTHSDKNVHVAKNGLMAWLPSLQKKFTQLYPLLAENGTPNSGSTLDLTLRITTLKVKDRLSKILQSLLLTRGALVELVEHVTKVYYEKRTICNDFEVVHESLNMRSVRFDETSVWGLKPIRLTLEPPYFKTEDGLMAYPMTPDAVMRVKNYACCFFKRDKQKWTTKDLQQLKTCIKEALYSRRLCALNDRYEVLMTDCLQQYENEMIKEGKHDTPPLELLAKKRGRPKKSELEYSSTYGIIYPVIALLPGGITIRSEVSPRMLAEWRSNEERKLKSKSYEELVFMENEKIDWDAVANKMVVKSRKHRTAEDCELAWRHEVHPKVNDRRWGIDESRRLKEIYIRLRNDWSIIAQELNVPTDLLQKPGRTPYQCFFRIRNRLDPPKKLSWTKELDDQVLDKLKEYPGNWRLVAASIKDSSATKRQVIERYKKTINPVLRNGAFTRVEDCLLILTIEKLKPFLAREGHFGCLLAYLPWRCETTWRDRANNLFSDWIVPWTLEEDKMLLTLAQTMNRNWQKISEEFTSFKNRKGCLTRYKILMRRLKDERFNNSLEAYHEAYSMTRYNVFQYKHLKEMLELLMRVKNKPLPENHQNFVGLLRDKEPSEVRLQHMLLTFDKDILDSAIKSLTRYVQTRDDYWRNWISKHGKRKRTFDRRTFHPDNPQSVASALHIRRLELVPKEEIPNISDFEDEIYKFYARFRRTKALKESAVRPYIPDAKTLAQWSAVSRIVETSVDKLEDVPIKRKWKSLKSESLIYRSTMEQKRDQLPKNILSKPTLKKISSIQKPKFKQPRLGGYQRKRGGGRKVFVATNEEGYLLIPPEPDIGKSVKRGRPRKNRDEGDPEFVIPIVRKQTQAKSMIASDDSNEPRRSSRLPKPSFATSPIVDDN